MTDEAYENDLYDDANEEFPGKDDIKDRLVAIWVNGNKGQRPGTNGKPYTYVETVTLVLDDGPDGKAYTNLVGPAPQRLDKFQYSQGGLVARLEPRIHLKNPETGALIYKPMIGRVNSRKNKTKGFSDSWSISAPTEDDRPTVERWAEAIREITQEIKAEREGGPEQEAFA